MKINQTIQKKAYQSALTNGVHHLEVLFLCVIIHWLKNSCKIYFSFLLKKKYGTEGQYVPKCSIFYLTIYSTPFYLLQQL